MERKLYSRGLRPVQSANKMHQGYSAKEERGTLFHKPLEIKGNKGHPTKGRVLGVTTR